MNHCNNGPNLKINDEVLEGLSLSTIEEILERELSGIK
jgi:NADH:ubiquinone oxidoreductase subunit E